jgi:tRNA (mo5U34)-methyltransferase
MIWNWQNKREKAQFYGGLTAQEIEREVQRLADEAAGDWCPGGGWQFPFDFGNGIVAPTYTPVQAMHTWRRDVMLQAVEERIPDRRDAVSVLDLGAGEGAMALGLWKIGFRDITCVEVRPLNVEKAQFAARVFGAKLDIRCTTVDQFLRANEKEYDIVLFMGLLYHLLNPFEILERIGKLTRQFVVLETTVSMPKLKGFHNRSDYAPTEAAFFLRIDSAKSHTAGLTDLELWPNKAAVEVLARHGGFTKLSWLAGPEPVPPDFASGSRLMAVAAK